MADLTTLADAKLYMGITGTTDSDLIKMLISDASSMIENELGSCVEATDLTEVKTGDYTTSLYLDNYPLITVYDMATQSTGVMTVTYTGNSPIATVSVDDDKVRLRTANNGTYETSDISFASYPVLSDISAAITAITGFTASTESEYTAFPSTDLVSYTPQDAIGSLYLDVWDVSYGGCEVKSKSYSLLVNPAEYGYGIFGSTKTWPRNDLRGWANRTNNIRIKYRAGYETVPNGIVSACNELVKLLYDHSKTDLALNKEKIGDYSYSRGTLGANIVTGKVQPMLSPSISAKLTRYYRDIVF